MESCHAVNKIIIANHFEHKVQVVNNVDMYVHNLCMYLYKNYDNIELLSYISQLDIHYYRMAQELNM